VLRAYWGRPVTLGVSPLTGKGLFDVEVARMARVNAAVLRREIACRGLEQREFADKAGISEATLSHCMGGRDISTATLRKLATAIATIPAIRGMSELVVVGKTSSDTPNSTSRKTRTTTLQPTPV
jgi:transcriptional regulator with XRE-family HTH domain